MPFTDEQVMLTLAGLSYRGFADFDSGEPHAPVVCREVLDGLRTLAPVRADWELVWGPVTDRGPRAVFDSSAMYVARHATDRHRHAVVVRGTNPVSVVDWLVGDLWVRSTVPWPYAPPADGVAVSASTAIGLRTLQRMRSAGVPTPAPPRAGLGATIAAGLAAGILRLEDVARRFTAPPAVNIDALHQSQGEPPVAGIDLRPTLPAQIDRNAPLDLLGVLRVAAESAERPLEVVVTGHSKGGALAPALALWLAEAARSGVPAERWDVSGNARVSCHAFAGPTPGNGAFAARIESVLGSNHRHLRNMNDIVTHAWQDDELRQIPGLYGSRSGPFAPLITAIADGVRQIGYRQVTTGVRRFPGKLVTARPFGLEFVHQHMDAYLEELHLVEQGIRAATFFV